ncbi:hypothetical protein [Mesorhizobium sp.]|jgi:hypothetical protein|uniref:hypothetical protein n=1 Tax=Mesorhizobium sp. TaxID=1871066 RepID=UPI0035620756
MTAHACPADLPMRRSIEDEIERVISKLDYFDADPDLEPWLAGGPEVVGTDDREGDYCDLEDMNNAEGSCAEDYGDAAWSNDPSLPQEGQLWLADQYAGLAPR